MIRRFLFTLLAGVVLAPLSSFAEDSIDLDAFQKKCEAEFGPEYAGSCYRFTVVSSTCEQVVSPNPETLWKVENGCTLRGRNITAGVEIETKTTTSEERQGDCVTKTMTRESCTCAGC